MKLFICTFKIGLLKKLNFVCLGLNGTIYQVMKLYICTSKIGELKRINFVCCVIIAAILVSKTLCLLMAVFAEKILEKPLY